MDFGKDFLCILHVNSPYKNKCKFVMDIVSSLCGEENPTVTNYTAIVNPKSEDHNQMGSYNLPESLRNTDGKNKYRLFDTKTLTDKFKIHIRQNKNWNTFKSYLNSTIDDENFAKLCNNFEVSDTINKEVMLKLFMINLLSLHG